MKEKIKENNYNVKQVMHLLQYEILFGVIWNILWANIFFKNQFINTSYQYLKIWTTSIITFSFISAFVYLTLLYLFIQYAKEKNERKFNFVVLMNQCYNCLSCFINVLLILVCINEYCFSQNFTSYGQLSDTIYYYLLCVGIIIGFVVLSAVLLLLSTFILSQFRQEGDHHQYQLIQSTAQPLPQPQTIFD